MLTCSRFPSRKIDLRLLPILGALYSVALIDRWVLFPFTPSSGDRRLGHEN